MPGKRDWYMLESNDYQHPSLGWIKRHNIYVYFGKKKVHTTHETCKPLDIAYLRTLDLKWRSASRVVEEPLDDLWKQQVEFLSM